MAASMAWVTIPPLTDHSDTACPDGESWLPLVVAEQQREIGGQQPLKTKFVCNSPQLSEDSPAVCLEVSY